VQEVKNVSWLFLLMCLISPLSAQERTGLSDYPLGAGDKLYIQVFGEEELSLEVLLSDAGTISYPFLGELQAKGLTTGKLSQAITEGLSDGYLVSPSVSVTVLEYRQFFIYGQVAKPGGYPYQPGLTLQKAVALAEGFTERASSNKFFLVREGHTDKNAISANLQTAILPGDIVTIEESFF